MTYKKDYTHIDKFILKKLGEGWLKVEIAAFLGCSIKTVASRCKANGWLDPNKSEAAKRGYRKDLGNQARH
jgi:uncharacterized protein YjcR